MRKIIIWSLLVLAVLLLAGSLLVPPLQWDGQRAVVFHIQVCDKATSEPIPGAMVQIVNPSGTNHISALEIENYFKDWPGTPTDHDGKITLRAACGAGGVKGLFRNVGSFVVTKELWVSAKGYQVLSIPLSELIGGER